MKNRYLTLVAVLLALITLGHADEAILEKVFKKEKTGTLPPPLQYHNRAMLFTPAHIGYERIKLNDTYWGIEAFESPVFNKHKKKSFANAELRVGHNFIYSGANFFTPFLMVGCAGANSTRHFFDIDYRFKEWGVVYGGAGFLYTRQFDPIFNLGLNAKLLLGGSVHQKHKKLGSPTIGTDIAIPFTFRFGRHQRWDFRLEPFFFGLYGQKGSVGYLGWRNSLGLRF
jgi:hypothetical protein